MGLEFDLKSFLKSLDISPEYKEVINIIYGRGLILKEERFRKKQRFFDHNEEEVTFMELDFENFVQQELNRVELKYGVSFGKFFCEENYKQKNEYGDLKSDIEEEDSVWFDPIDGGSHYLNGSSDFSISLGFLGKQTKVGEGAIPKFGIIYAPALDLMVFAQKDKGVYQIEKGRLSLIEGNNCTELKEVSFVKGVSFSTVGSVVISEFKDVKEYGSFTLKSIFAREGVFNCGKFAPKIWDSAAVSTVFNELGMSFYQFRNDSFQRVKYIGKEISHGLPVIVAANQEIYEKYAQAQNKHFASDEIIPSKKVSSRT